MPWKCHFLWMWSGARFLPAIAALGCCDCAWSTHPRWKGCVFLQFSSCPLIRRFARRSSPVQLRRWEGRAEAETGERWVANGVKNLLRLWVALGSKIGSLAWISCRHLSVFGQDQEPLKSSRCSWSSEQLGGWSRNWWNWKKGEIGLKRSFSASGRAAAAQAARVGSEAEGDNWNRHRVWETTGNLGWKKRKIQSSYQTGKMRLVNKTTGQGRRRCGSGQQCRRVEEG